MGKVLFSISEELLVDVMNMPEDTKIQFVGLKKGYNYTVIDILAEHDDVPKDAPIHETTPILEVVEWCTGCSRPTRLSWDWNTPEINNDI